MIIDTHAHYDDEAFDPDRESVIASFADNDIELAVNVGASPEGVRRSVELAHVHDRIYAAVGIHPDDVGMLPDDYCDTLKELAKDDKVVAVGEIGLDYYWDVCDRNLQKHWFIRQIETAKECGLPVIVHSRQAARDTLDIIKDMRLGETGAVMHCYSYSVEHAREYLDMGLFFGIGGVATFKNAGKLKEVIEYLPLSAMVLETDCPYLAPVPHRGERNSSLNLPYVAAAIADIKHISQSEVEEAARKNALRLYPKLAGRKDG